MAAKRSIRSLSLKRTIMKVRSALIAISFTSAATAQWAQVNNGIANLSNGAYTLGASDGHVFAKTLTALYR
ncbi:MAG: hypothetical protein WAT74_16040, partial [Flavobacteriales bacterium]